MGWGQSVMRERVFGIGVAFVALILASEGRADGPRAASGGERNWTGFYVGGHLGYAWGESGLVGIARR